jgi:hypothetical protein
MLLSGDRLVGEFSPSQAKIQDSNKKTIVLTFTNRVNPFLYYIISATAILAIFSLTVYFLTKNTSKVIVSLVTIAAQASVLYPTLTSGINLEVGMLFDKKSLFLFDVVKNFNLSPEIKILIGWQIIPVMLLFTVNAILVKRISSVQKYILAGLITTIILLLFVIKPENLTLAFAGKRAMVIFVAQLYGIIGMLTTLMMMYFLKNYKILNSILGALTLTIFALNTDNIFAEKRLIITAFEIEALKKTYSLSQDVTYIKNQEIKNTYLAIQPLTYTNLSYAEKLTNVKWKPKDQKSDFSNQKNKLIVIPTYLGAYDPYEIKNSHKKIFDNAQIAIYK